VLRASEVMGNEPNSLLIGGGLNTNNHAYYTLLGDTTSLTILQTFRYDIKAEKILMEANCSLSNSLADVQCLIYEPVSKIVVVITLYDGVFTINPNTCLVESIGTNMPADYQTCTSDGNGFVWTEYHGDLYRLSLSEQEVVPYTNLDLGGQVPFTGMQYSHADQSLYYVSSNISTQAYRITGVTAKPPQLAVEPLPNTDTVSPYLFSVTSDALIWSQFEWMCAHDLVDHSNSCKVVNLPDGCGTDNPTGGCSINGPAFDGGACFF